MPEPVTIQELNIKEPNQGCGCGCGGALCGTAWQELAFVATAADRDTNEATTERCDGSCGCGGQS